MKRHIYLILLVIAFVSMGVMQAQDEDRLRVVASTSIMADVARNVGGELVEVRAIVPIGADVHSFTPNPRDVAEIADADVVLINGMNLEAGLLEIIIENASAEPIVVSNGVVILSRYGHDADGHEGEDHEDDGHDGEDHEDDNHEDNGHDDYEMIGILGDTLDCDNGHSEDDHDEGDDHEHGPCDPHVWTNPDNVITWAQGMAEAFAAADPDNRQIYIDNAVAYGDTLRALDDEIVALVETIPVEKRVLVTNHDFLAYYAAHYGFEVVGTVIPAISTAAEVNPQDLDALINVIEAEGVRAIFAETSSNIDLAETVAAELGESVVVVSLYSGSLSDDDGPAATYVDYMRYNTAQIVNALAD